MLVDSRSRVTCNFPFPVLYFPTSRRSREFPRSLGCSALLRCTPQAYKACVCPALRPKKEPGVRNRDVSGLADGGADLSEARSWSDTPACVVDGGQDKAADGGQDMAASFSPPRKGRLPVRGELTSGGLDQLPGKPAEGHAPHRPFDENNHQLGPGASSRKVSHVGTTRVK